MLAYSDGYFLFYTYWATALHEIARRAMNGSASTACRNYRLFLFFNVVTISSEKQQSGFELEIARNFKLQTEQI